MVFNHLLDLFWYIIRPWNKEKKKTLLLQEEKKGKREKKFDVRPPGIEPGPTDSESDVLPILPSMHMALTCDQAQNAREWGLHIQVRHRQKQK